MAEARLTGTAWTGGGSAEARITNDHYPTPRECTVALLEVLKLPYLTYIWEPACGAGHISKVLIDYDMIVYSTDLVDYGYGITGIDYLNEPARSNIEAIITNPPFNLAQQFIEKAVGEAPIVAMLFKSQFWHAKSRFELFKKYPPKYVLPLTWRPQFDEGSSASPVMEVAWTVWDSSYSGACMYLPLEKPV